MPLGIGKQFNFSPPWLLSGVSPSTGRRLHNLRIDSNGTGAVAPVLEAGSDDRQCLACGGTNVGTRSAASGTFAWLPVGSRFSDEVVTQFSPLEVEFEVELTWNSESGHRVAFFSLWDRNPLTDDNTPNASAVEVVRLLISDTTTTDARIRVSIDPTNTLGGVVNADSSDRPVSHGTPTIITLRWEGAEAPRVWVDGVELTFTSSLDHAYDETVNAWSFNGTKVLAGGGGAVRSRLFRLAGFIDSQLDGLGRAEGDLSSSMGIAEWPAIAP